jgi:TIR domain/CHAT domain/AAA ATPase domain
MTGNTDVFISYSHEDQSWVEILAENLHQSGLKVFYDEWEIQAGDVLVHKLDEGILKSHNGILIVSPAALKSRWVQEEYAAMMTRAVEGQHRLIPVLLKEAEMPPLLAARVWVDFRTAAGPEYEASLLKLVKTLKGERAGPPPMIIYPTDSGFRAEGSLSCTLCITQNEVTLVDNGEVIRGTPPTGMTPRLQELLRQQIRARRQWGGESGALMRGTLAQSLDPLIDSLGIEIGKAFIPKNVATALETSIAKAERLNAHLEVGLEVADNNLVDLPWETLRLPTGIPRALILHPRVAFYRRVFVEGPSTAISIPGPLRILVAIGSPEAQNVRGELLDMEAELAHILDAVEPARQKGKASVRILNTGSLKAIHEALAQQRYHVLYISCHAQPGALILEDEKGTEDEVSAKRLWEEGLATGVGVPLIVLAGCSTGMEAQGILDAKQESLPSVARELVTHGVPAVIAMQGPVGDKYATALAEALFRALATWKTPQPLQALSEARRELEQARLREQQYEPAEWMIPTLYGAYVPLRLYDPEADFEEIMSIPEPTLERGVVVRRVGEFVGRRREQRLTLRSIRTGNSSGVLVHGIGGVGKSTLAAQVMHRLAQEHWFLVSLSGKIDNDKILAQVGHRLFSLCLAQSLKEDHPWRQLSILLRDPKVNWEERLGGCVNTFSCRSPSAFCSTTSRTIWTAIVRLTNILLNF